MKIEEHLKAIDIDSLINRLTKYAYNKLKSNNIKDFEGKQPIDFVSEVLCKSLEGIRDFEKANCSFEEFLFGSLKSDIDGFFRKIKKISDIEVPEPIIFQINDGIQELQDKIISWLEANDATIEELWVFELWVDGIDKPSVMAEELGITSVEVYNITKRLERKLKIVRQLLSRHI